LKDLKAGWLAKRRECGKRMRRGQSVVVRNGACVGDNGERADGHQFLSR
jgi:hypothetical protein